MHSFRFERWPRERLPPVSSEEGALLGMVAKRRGLIIELLDRLTEARLQRDARNIGYTEGDVTPKRTRKF
ncbi:hypothetical protein [Afipia felis]|uniref:Uncharacterized protein n=2 Tax=Afipia felis TaxID=1035 RepID=A0A380W7U0_AFIFE|nr:hypothetical protein [Afipia felis]EKS31348.1 hypothetical protein HMPREF9697_03876 [Afipia felis ATCC 53690]SUU76090.1 Uncharacterised protein [Afipia felis]SUU84157.1 Uncharacterised protein [Afipia felis]